MSRFDEKLEAFTDFARRLSTLSTCKRAKVGCIIVPYDFTQVYAIGYNGPERGAPNDSCSDQVGDCGCVHAETNALLKLSVPDNDCRLITTTCPCSRCAGLIVNKRQVSMVVYLAEYREVRGKVILERAGIPTLHYHDSRLMETWNDSIQQSWTACRRRIGAARHQGQGTVP